MKLKHFFGLLLLLILCLCFLPFILGADTDAIGSLYVKRDPLTTLTGAYTNPVTTNRGALWVEHDGALAVFPWHEQIFRCTVTVSTATTIQAVGGQCVAPGPGLSLYITGIQFSTSAVSGTAADAMPTLKYGTGATCGTGTTVFWLALTTANSTQVRNFVTPLKIPANNGVCWIMTTVGTKTLVISGFISQ